MLTTAAATALLAHAGHVDHIAAAGPSRGLATAVGFGVLAAVAGRALLARSSDRLMGAVALCSGAAGAIHAVVTPEHFEEYALFGVFFLAVTVWQMGVVVAALHRPSPALWTSTTLLTAAVLAVWVLSRTAGVPIGPERWTPEPTGVLDVACAIFEAGVVFGCRQLSLARRPAAIGPDGPQLRGLPV